MCLCVYDFLNMALITLQTQFIIFLKEILAKEINIISLIFSKARFLFLINNKVFPKIPRKYPYNIKTIIHDLPRPDPYTIAHKAYKPKWFSDKTIHLLQII